MTDRVYAEKLTPPLPPQDLLARPRLAGLAGPATLITGGPGAGQSVALVQLMDDAGLDHDAVAKLVQVEAAGLQNPADLYKQMPACLASLQASGL